MNLFSLPSFCFGVLVCWIIMGLVLLLIDMDLLNENSSIIILYPVLIIAIPILFIKAIIQIQWNYVLYPASQKQWEQISNSESIKFIHIKNFYIVFSKNASWFKKIFFLRVKSNTSNGINDINATNNKE